METKIVYKTSEEHTKKLMLEFFKKTSIPRILKLQQERDERNRDRAI
ncbi:MAG TPA: hypothetical protein VLA13_10490 [Massilibacterium sp.]|nr:hypothetical protein [Massilibacterium sp.]